MLSPIHLTNHARLRIREMRLDIEDVLDVLNNPEVEYSQRYKGEDQMVAQKGSLAVAYSLERGVKVVITVLLKTQEQYKRRWKIS